MEKSFHIVCIGANLIQTYVSKNFYVFPALTLSRVLLLTEQAFNSKIKQAANDNSPDALLMNLFITGAAKA